jgi:hypothetical protein
MKRRAKHKRPSAKDVAIARAEFLRERVLNAGDDVPYWELLLSALCVSDIPDDEFRAFSKKIIERELPNLVAEVEAKTKAAALSRLH